MVHALGKAWHVEVSDPLLHDTFTQNIPVGFRALLSQLFVLDHITSR